VNLIDRRIEVYTQPSGQQLSPPMSHSRSISRGTPFRLYWTGSPWGPFKRVTCFLDSLSQTIASRRYNSNAASQAWPGVGNSAAVVAASGPSAVVRTAADQRPFLGLADDQEHVLLLRRHGLEGVLRRRLPAYPDAA